MASSRITAASPPRRHAATCFLLPWNKQTENLKKKSEVCFWSERTLVTLRLEMIDFVLSLWWYWEDSRFVRIGWVFHRDRKWVAVTNTMTTQRLFHVYFFFNFCTFAGDLFCCYWIIWSIWLADETAACMMSPWRCQTFVQPLFQWMI